MYDPGAGAKLSADVCLRAGFETDTFLEGPAIVTEGETTMIVPAGFTAVMCADGCIDLRRAEA